MTPTTRAPSRDGWGPRQEKGDNVEQDSRQRLVLEFLDVSRERIEAEYRTLVYFLDKGNALGLTRDEMAGRLRFKREDLDRLLDGGADE